MGLSDTEVLARVLRALRALRGLSQQQLAERSDLSTAAYGRIERGERVREDVPMDLLREALEVSPAELHALERFVRRECALRCGDPFPTAAADDELAAALGRTVEREYERLRTSPSRIRAERGQRPRPPVEPEG